MVSKLLAGEDVGQMHLDEWDPYSRERIAQAHAGMGKSRWINNYYLYTFQPRVVNPIDQFCLAVALKYRNVRTVIARAINEMIIYLLQRLGTVVLRLTAAEQVEIRTMDYEDLFCFSHPGLWDGDRAIRSFFTFSRGQAAILPPIDAVCLLLTDIRDS